MIIMIIILLIIIILTIILIIIITIIIIINQNKRKKPENRISNSYLTCNLLSQYWACNKYLVRMLHAEVSLSYKTDVCLL